MSFLCSSFPTLFSLSFSFFLGLCCLWPSCVWGVIVRTPPEQHPEPCLNPHDPEKPCEVMRSASMGYLCKWGHSTPTDSSAVGTYSHVELAAWRFPVELFLVHYVKVWMLIQRFKLLKQVSVETHKASLTYELPIYLTKYLIGNIELKS